MQPTMMAGKVDCKLSCSWSILSTPGKVSVSSGYIKRNTVYNITKASTAIQCLLNFNRIVVSIFGYNNFLRGKWGMNYILCEVS